MATEQKYPRFIRRGKPLQQLYGLSRSTQYRLVEQGKLRKPTQITPHLQGWLREHLEADLLGLNNSDNSEK